MILNLSQTDTKANVFPTSDAAMSRHDNGPSLRAIWRKGPPSFARWNKPKWGLFFLLVLTGNVLVATLAWIIVRLVTG
jgi:hypothetical protein